MTQSHPHARPLSVERIREVLEAWPPATAEVMTDTATEPDLALVADYHRIVEIHQRASEGGVRVAREALEARLDAEMPAGEVADALPAGDALTSRRMARVRAGRHETTRAVVARLAAIEPDEEAAVLACRAEIEAALARQR